MRERRTRVGYDPGQRIPVSQIDPERRLPLPELNRKRLSRLVALARYDLRTAPRAHAGSEFRSQATRRCDVGAGRLRRPASRRGSRGARDRRRAVEPAALRATTCASPREDRRELILEVPRRVRSETVLADQRSRGGGALRLRAVPRAPRPRSERAPWPSGARRNLPATVARGAATRHASVSTCPFGPPPAGC